MGKRNPVATWLDMVPAKPETLDRFDYPYVELTAGVPEATEHDWCDLDSEEASIDRGKVHVGGQIQTVTWGLITTKETDRLDGKPQPTNYAPDPRGLKGGVG